MSRDLEVGLKIVDKTGKFDNLARGVDELKRAGGEVDDLKESLQKLSAEEKNIANQTKLITNFKSLKKASVDANKALKESQAESKKYALSLASLEGALKGSQESYAKTADKLDRFSNRLQEAKDRVKQLQQAQKDDKRNDYSDAIKKSKLEVERFTKAKRKLTVQVRESKTALTGAEKAFRTEARATEKAIRETSKLKAKKEQLNRALQRSRAELKRNGIKANELAKIQARLNNKTKLLENGMIQVARAMKKAREEIDKNAKSNDNLANKAKKSKSGMSGLALKAGAATVAIASVVAVARKVVTAFTDVDREFDRMGYSFTEVTGSTESANVEMARMIDVANRLGVSFTDVSQGYVSFASSAKGLGFSMSESADMFERTSQKVLALGGDTNSISGVLTAFSQILSKGKVATEELNQIAERLPGTFNFASEALGVTSGELRKMLEQGQVVSQDFLPKFIDQLKTTSNAQDTNVVTSAKLRNEWDLLVKSLDDSLGVSDSVQDSMSELAQALRLMRHETEGNINIIPEGSSESISAIFPTITTAKKLFDYAADSLSNYAKRQNEIGDANAKVKQTTDELTQSSISLNKARQGGGAKEIAKAELEYAKTLGRTKESYSQIEDAESRRTEQVNDLKAKLSELTPEQEKLTQALKNEKAAGLDGTQAYAERSKKLDELSVKTQSYKQSLEDLSQVKVGGGAAVEDAEKTQQAVESLTQGLVAQRAKLADLEALYAKSNTTGKDSINMHVGLYGAIIDTKEAIKGSHAALSEINSDYTIVNGTIGKTATAFDDSVTKAREYEEALKAAGLTSSEIMTGMNEVETTIVGTFDSAIEKIQETAKSSEQAGEAVERYLVASLGKVKSPEAMRDFIEKLKSVPNQTEAVKASIDKLQDRINKSTPEWVRLADAIGKATDTKQLKDFGEEAYASFKKGELSAEQYAQQLEKIDEKQKALSESQKAAAKKATEAKESQARAEKLATEAINGTSDAMQQQTQQIDKNTQVAKENRTEKETPVRRPDVTSKSRLYDPSGLTDEQKKAVHERAKKLEKSGRRRHAAGINVDYRPELKNMVDVFKQQNERGKEKSQIIDVKQLDYALKKHRTSQPPLDTQKVTEQIAESFAKELQIVKKETVEETLQTVSKGLERYRKGQGR